MYRLFPPFIPFHLLEVRGHIVVPTEIKNDGGSLHVPPLISSSNVRHWNIWFFWEARSIPIEVSLIQQF
jgi:hypothetical protein